MHDLAIIMPTHNRSLIAAQNLRKIRNHFPGVPIYLFDDASCDREGAEAAANAVDGCILIRSDRCVGPAGARRKLLEVARARWVLALDDDCYPRADFDPAKWVAMEPGPADPIAISFRYLRSYDGCVAPPGDLAAGPAQYLIGGASLLHRQSVIAIGNYNAFYIFGAEDADLSRRVWASGRQLWIDPENYIVHDHVAGGRDLPRECYYYARNRILLNALSLPLWYGMPLGAGQAIKYWLTHPYKLSGFIGICAGLSASIRHFGQRRPLTLKQFRQLNKLRA